MEARYMLKRQGGTSCKQYAREQYGFMQQPVGTAEHAGNVVYLSRRAEVQPPNVASNWEHVLWHRDWTCYAGKMTVNSTRQLLNAAYAWLQPLQQTDYCYPSSSGI
jgi:hypothetical protein